MSIENMSIIKLFDNNFYVILLTYLSVFGILIPTTTRRKESFLMGVESTHEDNEIVDVFLHKWVYEEHIVNVWLTLLNNYPNATVLDLGSNIGVFTLVSSTMGNKVISVDPSPQMHAILYNSLVLNNVHDRVIQVMNPISDGYFEYSGNSLKEGETTHTYLDIEVPGNKTLTSKTITLFDVFDIEPKQDTFIIKIDVQGFECKALTEFFRMTNKPKFVPYIQMETVELCDSAYGSECFASYQTEFLPLIEKSGYIPHVPLPVTFQEIIETCYFDVLFVHKDAKPFPYWDEYLSQYSFLDNMHTNK